MAQRTASPSLLFSLNGATDHSGTITISAITPPDEANPFGSVTISGGDVGWSASTTGGVSTITLQSPTYPVVYTLTFVLDSSVAENFEFVNPAGQITFVCGTVQSCGFLLPTAVLRMFHAAPPETADVTYNLSLLFQTKGANPTQVQIDDPTIVFDPPPAP